MKNNNNEINAQQNQRRGTGMSFRTSIGPPLDDGTSPPGAADNKKKVKEYKSCQKEVEIDQTAAAAISFCKNNQFLSSVVCVKINKRKTGTKRYAMQITNWHLFTCCLQVKERENKRKVSSRGGRLLLDLFFKIEIFKVDWRPRRESSFFFQSRWLDGGFLIDKLDPSGWERELCTQLLGSCATIIYKF